MAFPEAVFPAGFVRAGFAACVPAFFAAVPTILPGALAAAFLLADFAFNTLAGMAFLS
ncbi:hypothetical protein [Ferrovibrio terrae]|jgi:hypothetical protein|uniref:hypothetical protein n=1 Tax=Ferrovibrio terrae TaxID=2594003 RepID=UPI003137790F